MGILQVMKKDIELLESDILKLIKSLIRIDLNCCHLRDKNHLEQLQKR